jgi:hypothetical protein
MKPRVAKHVNRVPRERRTDIGITGSVATYISFMTKTGSAKADRMSGIHRILGPDKPRRNRMMVVINSKIPE